MAPDSDRESADAERVNEALQNLMEGDLDKAESLLLAVIANTPDEYVDSFEDDNGISIKFWDQAAFIHYVTWHKENATADRGIVWIGNAYPRAHYYMGFLCVKRKQFERAIEFLTDGQKLEPSNPNFLFEKAQALVHTGRKQAALALYDQVTEISERVSARELGVARRGRGFVMIEMGDLDTAEIAFRSSLEIDPGNEVALGELQYIQYLRQGGAVAPGQAVQTGGSNLSNCAVCGHQYDEGVIVQLDGQPVGICNKCKRKLTKKWWQFWK